MKLNHDCIRDILLFVEDHTTSVKYYVLASDLQDSLADTYSLDTINYHIYQVKSFNLVEDVSFADGRNPIRIFDLTPFGHEYVSNIRDNKVWSKIKSSTNKLASVGIEILIAKASEIAFSLL